MVFEVLGNRLRQLRKQRKLTQEEVARKIGVARTTYAMYEQNSREPDNKTIQKLADYFQVSIDYLLGRETEGEDRQYGMFLREIKEKYPGVDINDPDIRRKLMMAIDLVLDDYSKRQ